MMLVRGGDAMENVMAGDISMTIKYLIFVFHTVISSTKFSMYTIVTPLPAL